MKIGFLSDAHGNHLALGSCLHALKALHVELVYFLGDAVGYLPGESEVLNLLRSAGVHCQLGNHEAMLLGEISVSEDMDEIYRISGARERLLTADYDYIASWPNHRIINRDGKKLLLIHGSPDNYLQGYLYLDDDMTMFDRLDCDAVFMGHTHHAFVKRRQNKLLVNVGSCGLPRDRRDLCAFAIYDTHINECKIFRVSFDNTRIVEHFGEKQLPIEVVQRLKGRDSTAQPL